MVYSMAGGSTDYDPSLQGLPRNNFLGMDGDLSDVKIADATPDDGGFISAGSRHIGRPVLTDKVPTKLRRTGPGVKRAKLLDVNQQSGKIDIVNQTFKDIVEEFEPDIHQFFPMEFYDSKGKEKIGNGYWMIVCKRLDTLHDTLCIPPRNEKGFIDWYGEQNADRDKTLDRTVFSREKVVGHHMWHDKFFPGGHLFSDELGERLLAADFSGLVYSKYDEA